MLLKRTFDKETDDMDKTQARDPAAVLREMVIGTAYYPEHWPRERWQTDIDLMARAGIRVVRLAELAWSRMEPEDGVFDFAWLDDFMDLAGKQGLRFVLGTPTEASPVWLRRAHPEVMSVNAQGLRTGGRGQHCHNSEAFRFYSARVAERMAAHFAAHPGVIGWQIDNEVRPVPCHCDSCRRAFRAFLKQRYSTVEALNRAWGTWFWSQTYRDFEEVETPSADQLTVSTSQILDFKRFVSDTTVGFVRMQAAILKRAAPHQFVAHNTIGIHTPIDMYDLHRELDFAAWDNYPHVDGDMRENNLGHDLYRSTKHQAYWMLEQKNGYFNGANYNLAIAPGLVRAWAYNDIARGANGVLFYRWRSNRWGQEQNPNGILRHDGSPRRAYGEIQRLTRELQSFGRELAATSVRAEVAILHSYDNFWAFEANRQYANSDCVKLEREMYNALSDLGVTADLVRPEEDLSRYKLVLAPNSVLVGKAAARIFEAYVEQGGHIVFGVRSGLKDENNVMVDIPWPGLLAGLCGITVEEFEAFPAHAWNQVSYQGRDYDVRWWADVLAAGPARIEAVYAGRFYRGAPAITRHGVGKGSAAYIGVAGCPELLRDYFRDRLKELGIPVTEMPENTYLTIRENAERRYVFLVNLSFEERVVPTDFSGTDRLTGRKLCGDIAVPPLDVVVLETSRKVNCETKSNRK